MIHVGTEAARQVAQVGDDLVIGAQRVGRAEAQGQVELLLRAADRDRGSRAQSLRPAARLPLQPRARQPEPYDQYDQPDPVEEGAEADEDVARRGGVLRVIRARRGRAGAGFPTLGAAGVSGDGVVGCWVSSIITWLKNQTGLTRRFGGLTAVNKLDLTVTRGQIHALIEIGRAHV